MPSYKPATPTIEPLNVVPSFVDRLVKIEKHGPVTHLIWAVTMQDNDGLPPGPVAAVQARLIVPTEILPRLARQLASPDERSDDPPAGLINVVVLQ